MRRSVVSFCGACRSACPDGLWPGEIFAGKRSEAVRSGEFDVASFATSFPTAPIMSWPCTAGSTASSMPIWPRELTPHLFFPGCTLMSYSPVLTRAVFAHLQEQTSCQAIWTDCCGKLLEQRTAGTAAACPGTADSYAREHAITRIITACPGCYYDMKKLLQPVGIRVESVYENLVFKAADDAGGASCTVHDSCPDRFTGEWGRQVRDALQQRGYSLVEMPHSGSTTICCGSGGQLSHFRPDLVEELTDLRRNEFAQTGAAWLVAYCLSCVLKYDSMLAVCRSPMP